MSAKPLLGAAAPFEPAPAGKKIACLHPVLIDGTGASSLAFLREVWGA
jgi:hypothetical protein